MADKTKWDIDNENFSYYFQKLSDTMTEQQLNALPKDLYFKLYKTGGKYNTKDTTKLSFLAKLYILIKSFKKRVIIIVEDDKEGMDEEAYFKYKKLLHKRQYSISGAADLIEDATFVLGNKELMDTYSAMNGLSASNAYNYLIKEKNSIRSKTEQHVQQMNYIVSLLVKYDSSRKKIHMNSGLNMSEWLVLLALYNGEELQSSKIYNEIYKHSFNSSKTKKKKAFGTLEAMGYIQKFGKLNGLKLKITPLGRAKINEIVSEWQLLL